MKKIFVLMLSIVFTFQSNAQSGWVWQNPLPQGNEITEIQFLNSTTAYASTYGCSLMKTTDAGLTWQHFPTDDSRSLACCYFFNENTGFVGGNKLKFKKTIDGCKTWTDIQTGIINQFLWVAKIKFLNHNTGYIAAGGIYKTTNAGVNWVSKSEYAADFQFIDENTGYIIGRDFYTSYIKKTTNGGMTWQTQYTTGVSSTYKIQFVDVNTGYVCMLNVLKTTNGGENWAEISNVPPLNNHYFASLDFVNASTGFLLGGSNFIAKTTTGGSPWDTVTLNSDLYLTYIKFSNLNTGFASGYLGTICRTANSGSNWVKMSSGFGNIVACIQFFNSQTGYAVGGNRLFTKTTDGGQNWVKLNFEGPIEHIGGLYFFNPITGFIIGTSNNVLKTTNSGVNWTNNSVPGGNIVLNCIKFYGPSIGLITAIDGKVYRTTDGGSIWQQVVDIYNPAFGDISFADANTVFICGSNYGSPILKSTNTGLNWEVFNTNINSLYGIFFVDNLTGYCTGSNGSILKTTNCGINWFTQSSGTTKVLTKIFFTDLNTGYVVGFEGEILKTTNSGVNWIRLQTITNTTLHSLFFINNTTGFIAGEFGHILKTTTGGEPVGISQIKNEIPVKSSLSQNYPNPFNPNTKIKFAIPLSRRVSEGRGVLVSFVIYDILGREIATLVNEQLQPGTYEVEWDPEKSGQAGLSSGVYFYKLITADYSETRKMVLIK